jgi:putative ABC transport system ATP-binding protein
MTDQNTTAAASAETRPLDHPVFALSGVSKRYGSGASEVFAVRDVDLEIASGDYAVIVGPSGSGKSTLLQLLAGLDRPTSGSIDFDGRDLASLDDRELSRVRRDEIGIVFQQFNLIPTLTAEDNIRAALAPAGKGSEAQEARACELLEQVGLSHRLGHLPSQLSGGEQQRVAIARALANRPRVLLADEPTGNLDTTTGGEILDLLSGLSAQEGQTVVLITHDEGVAAHATLLLRMRDGGLESARGGA